MPRLHPAAVFFAGELGPGAAAALGRSVGAGGARGRHGEELGEAIQAALQTLPEHHRAAIVLREIEGMSYEQMAEALEVPKGTVMSRLFHARKKMQAALAPYLSGEKGSEE